MGPPQLAMLNVEERVERSRPYTSAEFETAITVLNAHTCLHVNRKNNGVQFVARRVVRNRPRLPTAYRQDVLTALVRLLVVVFIRTQRK